MIPRQRFLARALMNSLWDHATPGKRITFEDRPRAKLCKSDTLISDGMEPMLMRRWTLRRGDGAMGSAER